MANLNLYSDMSSIAQNVQENAVFVIRETYVMPDLVQVFNDMSGSNPRVGYTYNQGTAGTIAEADDLTSHSFIPSADQTLTPIEIGLQFFIGDQRADSSGNLPENVLTEAAQELGYAAGDQIQTHLLQTIGSLTAGTIGAYGSALAWSHYSACIAGARQANKSSGKPMTCVLHGYQWAKLASSASVAGAAVVNSPQFSEELSRKGYVREFMGIPFVQVYAGTPAVNGTGGTAWFTGAVFPREAVALDWRRPIRIRAERDESRRGVELNMTAVYAYGLWKPARGYCIAGFATQPVV
jgi:hypothetical protein